MNTDKVFSPCEMCIVEYKHGEKMCGHCDYHIQKKLSRDLIDRYMLDYEAKNWFEKYTKIILNQYIRSEYTKKEIDISEAVVVPKLYMEEIEADDLYIGVDIYISGIKFIHKSIPPIYLMIIIDFPMIDEGVDIYQMMWNFAKEYWHYYFDATQESLKKYAEIVGIDESELA